MKKIFKWLLKIIGSLIVLLLIVGVSFLYISPQFGGKASKEQIEAYGKTGHFENGIFLNDEPMEMEINCHSVTQMLKETMEPDPNVSPKVDIKVQKISRESIQQKLDSVVRITWFGHSTLLIEMDSKKLLIDPIFSQYAAPHPLLGRKRYNSQMPITIEELPQINAVFISHDHYDHLDYESIKKLKAKVNHFFVPLGVANHLKYWGIDEKRITEMDWWQELSWENMEIAFTPSRHMSGRGLGDQSTTLWGSWVFKGNHKNIFYSGDGGYGKHFAEIGNKYGPFDMGIMECGQYNKLWADVHLMPEQTIQASIDVKAKRIIPVHWGAYTLATHSWTDPIERVTTEAIKMNIPIATPKIGEPIYLKDSTKVFDNWWTNF